MKLNARQVETAKPKEKTYKMADGGGLYLEISAKGSKYWRMKYRRPSDKKEDRLAFGIWPTVTLAQARAKRDEAKKLLGQGIDPKAEQKEVEAENAGAYTFETMPVSGTRATNAGVRTTDRAFFVILSCISSRLLARLIFASSKPAIF